MAKDMMDLVVAETVITNYIIITGSSHRISNSELFVNMHLDLR